LVATLGYFTPDISLERLPAASAGAQIQIKLKVTPGEATLVSEVELQFEGEIASDASAAEQRAQITASWLLPKGSRFTQTTWDAAKQQALKQLTIHRFAAGKISSTQADIDAQTHQAKLKVVLDSGPAYQLGDLVITGLVKHDPELVRRLARLSSGTAYEQLDLVEAQQRLANSGFFDSAYVAIDTASDPKAARVNVTLQEGRMQKIVLALGLSTDTGPRLSVEHTHHQVPIIGWRAISKVQFARDQRSVESELMSPPDDANWRWAVSGLLKNELLGTSDVSSLRLRGGRVQSNLRIDRNLYLQYDRAATVDSDTVAPSIAQSITANYGFAVRYYDDLPFPSRGWGWAAEFGGGSTLGAKQQAYTRIVSRLQGFVPLGDSQSTDPTSTRASVGRISLRGGLGLIGAPSDASLPSTQLFLAGGDNSVRGYALHDIGITLADGSITAGRYMVTAGAEWQHPLHINGKLSDWESTVFIDTGAVANQPSELTLKVGVGVGVRWKGPVGPLQIDLAYGVDPKRLRLHLNLGFTF
jgi:translocation and assembly module TamA